MGGNVSKNNCWFENVVALQRYTNFHLFGAIELIHIDFGMSSR